ncbi:MAG: cation:proton antiporter [Mogibacterium sp.]|nr:cation:proton antiporter [Mogibacterium sp.]
MEIPSLIIDLAIMLMTAAVVTILFKRIHLPLILGYIVAGFLISPYFPLFFDVANQESIDTWSEIGVVIILFHIGLEFNLLKFKTLGSTAIISAAVKMSGVMLAGYEFGRLTGLSPMNCIFLGAMLSISSTVVIQKCFEELGIREERYASLVMGSLVMEDVLGIFIMVVLSTISVSQSINGAELALNLAMMLIYLIVWLLLGIFILPTFLNRYMELISDEMLTVLSMGLCFFMALVANRLGFSMELGAFLAGSLLAGTVHADRIEHITKGIKDMFGAIFFLSVGMMVDPSVIVSRWTSIVPIAILAVAFKLVFATIGMVMSGQDLETAVKGGVSLAPIGEFSFIIASLGISLGVMDSYLYPVIVAASILTTIFTPTFIRRSDRVVALLERILPNWLLKKIEEYTSKDPAGEERTQDWTIVMRSFFGKILIYGVIMLMAALLGTRFLAPALAGVMPETPAKIAACVAIYLVIILFLRPMLDFHSVSFTHLWLEHLTNRPPLVMLIILKLAVVAVIAYIPIYTLFGSHQWLLLLAVLAVLLFVGRSDFIATSYLQLETRFLRNLNERTLDQEEEARGKQRWLDEDYSIVSFIVPQDAPYKRKSLNDLGWGRNLDIYVVKVEHKDRVYLLPSGDYSLAPGDKVYIVGDERSLETFYATLGFEQKKPFRTLAEFMETDYPDPANALACLAIKVRGHEPYCNKPIRASNIQSKGHCMVLGIQKDGYTYRMLDANMLIQPGDILWVMGSNNNVGRMAARSTAPDRSAG